MKTATLADNITLTIIPRHKTPDYGWVRSAGECSQVTGCHLEYEDHKGASDGLMFHMYEDDEPRTCVVTPDGDKVFNCKRTAGNEWSTGVDYVVREGNTHR